MEMNRFTWCCIKEGEEHSGFLTSVMPFQSRFSIKPSKWLIPIRHWLCVISHISGWKWMSFCIHIKNFEESRAWILTDRQGSTFYLLELTKLRNSIPTFSEIISRSSQTINHYLVSSTHQRFYRQWLSHGCNGMQFSFLDIYLTYYNVKKYTQTFYRGALYRLPPDSIETEDTDDVNMFYNAVQEMFPLTSKQISSLT